MQTYVRFGILSYFHYFLTGELYDAFLFVGVNVYICCLFPFDAAFIFRRREYSQFPLLGDVTIQGFLCATIT